MNHCCSEIFGGGCVLTNSQCNLVGRPVVFHHTGMVDRNVGGTLIEFGYGIAANLHDRGNQVVRFRDRALRGIDKAGLHGLPLL